MAWTVSDPVNSVTVASLPGHIRDTKTGILDDDAMEANSATDVCSQQSIVAYVKSGTYALTNKTLTSPTVNGTGVTLAAGADLIGSSTSDITINTNKFTVAGATGNTVIAGTCGIAGAATALSLDIGSTVAIVGTLDEDDLDTDSATQLATQQSIKAYVDASHALSFAPTNYAADSGSDSRESATFPNGMIMKTGKVADGTSGGAVEFATAFPNGIVSIQLTYYDPAAPSNGIAVVIDPAASASGFTYIKSTSADGFYWTAIGY